MKTRAQASRRSVEVVRKRKPAASGRHLVWRRGVESAAANDGTDLSSLMLYGQA
ncbi:hypothetical protein [Phenylobacterium deserti]|uniref:hypothetical protein n=1 Tax=Phenylobacterium deserti TaxID=1914756 RepID=UPI0014031D24|nr:hypothetical protein [Phenylobacterium deserti]